MLARLNVFEEAKIEEKPRATSLSFGLKEGA